MTSVNEVSGALRVVQIPFDSANPYQSLLARGMAEYGIDVRAADARALLSGGLGRKKVDVLHLHWLHYFTCSKLWRFLVILPVLTLQLMVHRLMRRRIIWTVHNLRSHTAHHRGRERLLALLVARFANVVIAHSDPAAEQIAKVFRVTRRKIVVIPHGNYCAWYANTISKEAARRRLDVPLSATVMLFFGAVKRYKGVIELIRDFSLLGDANTVLIIAGQPSEELEQEIKERISGKKNIRFVPSYIADHDVQMFMKAADVVVFPYREIFTSGAVMLAISFGRACIAPRIGYFEDVLDEQGAFLYGAEEQNGLLRALQTATESQSRLAEMGEYNRRMVDQWSWDRVARLTYTAYKGKRTIDTTAGIST